MESNNSNDIKKRFKIFSQQRGYKYFDSDPVIAPPSSRLLFNISGGVKYQDELLELKSADYPRVASIQKCIRTDNMDSVGISGRHHIFFEMLGHFSFYGYDEKTTKENFIEFSYDFLTKEVGLEKDRIFATVHPLDEVTRQVWKKIGNSNIICSENNIFISPYADKSSLRTEILWQRDDEEKSLVELWNLVFTQFNSKNIFENPSLSISADSGASLERIVSAYENKNNNYENSMWSNYVENISLLGNCDDRMLFRKIADLSNAAVNLVKENLMPGNKTQAYMLRKMMRTLFDACDDCQIDYKDVISYLTNDETIKATFIGEKLKYNQIISNGLKQASKIIQKNGIDNIDYQYLKSTCGLSTRYIDMLKNLLNNEKQENVQLIIKKLIK